MDTYICTKSNGYSFMTDQKTNELQTEIYEVVHQTFWLSIQGVGKCVFIYVGSCIMLAQSLFKT